MCGRKQISRSCTEEMTIASMSETWSQCISALYQQSFNGWVIWLHKEARFCGNFWNNYPSLPLIHPLTTLFIFKYLKHAVVFFLFFLIKLPIRVRGYSYVNDKPVLQELVRSSPSSWCHKAKMATAHTCTDANWNESGKSCDSGELGVIQDMMQKQCEESGLPWSDQKSACMRRRCQREWFHFFMGRDSELLYRVPSL